MCNNADDRQKYIDRYKDELGIILDPARMRLSNAARSLSKLLMNSSWLVHVIILFVSQMFLFRGKLAERSSSNVEICHNRKDLLRLFAKPQIEVQSYKLLSVRVYFYFLPKIDLRSVDIQF